MLPPIVYGEKIAPVVNPTDLNSPITPAPGAGSSPTLRWASAALDALSVYTDSASRAADAHRSVGEDPAPGAGVIGEFKSVGFTTGAIFSPYTMGGNMDNPVGTTIYASIKNLSTHTQSITGYLTILQLEA